MKSIAKKDHRSMNPGQSPYLDLPSSIMRCQVAIFTSRATD